MNRERAERHIRNGAVAATLSAGLTGLIVTIAVLTEPQSGAIAYFDDPWLVVDIAALLLLALGVSRKSRTAAVLLVVYFLIALAVRFVDTGRVTGLLGAVVWMYFYVNALRGAFAYHRIARAEDPDYRAGKVLPIVGGTVAAVLCASALLYVLGEAGITPSSRLVSGVDMSAESIRLLREHGVLLEDENVELFYSEGLASILEGGSVLTDRGVTVYAPNGAGTLDVYELTYEQIRDVQLEQRGGFLDWSIYRVHGYEGDWVGLYLPAEEDQDRQFVRALERKVEAAARAASI